MDRAPTFRARGVQESLERLRKFEPAAHDEICRMVGQSHIEALLAVEPFEWIAFEDDLPLSRAVFQVLGRGRVLDHYRALLAALVKSPVFRTTLQTTVRLFGLSPTSLARATPAGWSMMFRDVATVQVGEVNAGSVGVHLTDVHPQVLAEEVYWHNFRGIFAGYLDLCSVRGAVTFSADAATKSLTYTISWANARAA